MLTNSAPVAANTVLADITQIANGNGYTTGGTAATISSSAQTSGTYKLVLADVTFHLGKHGAGSAMPSSYNDTATSDELIGYWDYGSSSPLAASETASRWTSTRPTACCGSLSAHAPLV